MLGTLEECILVFFPLLKDQSEGTLGVIRTNKTVPNSGGKKRLLVRISSSRIRRI
jgi:hypothetical protein